MSDPSPLHVLVIASDAVLRAATCASLNRDGCVASGVPDAPAALAYLTTSRVDVLVEDISHARLESNDYDRALASSGPPLVLFGEPAFDARGRVGARGAAAHAHSLADLRATILRVAKAGSDRASRTTQVPRYTDRESRSYKLLLVDDSEVTLELIQGALTAAGFDVRIAVAATEAAAIVATWRPDVAVVDLRRPDSDDSSLCAVLKEKGVALTLVASSLTEAELLRASREAFADGYVSKARGVRAFVARIEELVARSLGAASRPESPVPDLSDHRGAAEKSR